MDRIDWNQLWWEDNAHKVILFWVGLGVLVLGIVGLVIRSAVRGASPQPARRPAGYVPVATPEAAIDEPGLYEISGIDRATKMDTTWRVRADNQDNAKMKGELEGIAVTRVRFISR